MLDGDGAVTAVTPSYMQFAITMFYFMKLDHWVAHDVEKTSNSNISGSFSTVES